VLKASTPSIKTSLQKSVPLTESLINDGPNNTLISHYFSSATSRSHCCIVLQIRQSSGFTTGPLDGHIPDKMNYDISHKRCHWNRYQL